MKFLSSLSLLLTLLSGPLFADEVWDREEISAINADFGTDLPEPVTYGIGYKRGLMVGGGVRHQLGEDFSISTEVFINCALNNKRVTPIGKVGLNWSF